MTALLWSLAALACGLAVSAVAALAWLARSTRGYDVPDEEERAW